MDTELHMGACLCDAYELRITERCLTDDLGYDQEASFERALGHQIVKALLKERSQNPGAGETIGPAAGDRTLYKLRRSNDHRGATLFDPQEGVVWLCAYGFHRSKEDDDAYKVFVPLIQSREIFPSVDDYRRLGRERNRRFRDLVPGHAKSIAEEALRKPGVVITGRLGRELTARVHATVSGDVSELLVAFPAAQITSDRVETALAGLTGDDEPLWEVVGEIAGAPLDGEVGFRLYRKS